MDTLNKLEAQDRTALRWARGQRSFSRGEAMDSSDPDIDPWFAYGWTYSALLEARAELAAVVEAVLAWQSDKPESQRRLSAMLEAVKDVTLRRSILFDPYIPDPQAPNQ
jgi:hypothetical protein